MSVERKWVQDDLSSLMDALPPRITQPLENCEDLHGLLEVVLDLGRPPEARFPNGDLLLDEVEVSHEDLDYIDSRVGEFGDDNRAGIPRTLHRISAIRNRKGDIVGMTCRVGRAVYGTIQIIDDLVALGKSILLLGRPGVGKTTMLRETARVLADDAKKRVIIVDTSNEIGGDGDIPHPAIGHSRRMQVATPPQQHAVMIEAVENHMPQVIIIDEMGTEQEAAAARTIAERGVQLIATAHGNTLDNLLMNPTLSDLVGGMQPVTLGDEEARRRGTQKTILERKAPPTFDVVVEIQNWEKVAVHEDVARVVDTWLRGFPIDPETRWLNADGEVMKTREVKPQHQSTHGAARHEPAVDPVEPNDDHADHAEERRVFLFGVGRERVVQAAQNTGLSVDVVNELRASDVVLTTKSHYRRGPQLVRAAEKSGKPIYVLRKNSLDQVEQFLKTVAKERDDGSHLESALQETQDAAQKVLGGAKSVDLTPQRAYVRRLQHLLAERYQIASVSSGKDPQRRVTIFRA